MDTLTRSAYETAHNAGRHEGASEYWSTPVGDRPPGFARGQGGGGCPFCMAGVPIRNDEDVIETEHLRRWTIEQVERVVATRGAEIIDGTICDMSSAALIVQVWKQLSDVQKVRAERASFGAFGSICWKVAAKHPSTT